MFLVVAEINCSNNAVVGVVGIHKIVKLLKLNNSVSMNARLSVFKLDAS